MEQLFEGGEKTIRTECVQQLNAVIVDRRSAPFDDSLVEVKSGGIRLAPHH
jgi:hypothetical protein